MAVYRNKKNESYVGKDVPKVRVGMERIISRISSHSNECVLKSNALCESLNGELSLTHCK